MALNPQDFQFIATLLKDKSGLALTQDKEYLLDSRLTPVARAKGYGHYSDLIKDLRSKQDATVIQEIVEAMTTNESLFFRDNKPFEALKQHVLPVVRERAGGRKKLRIWSAACSTGQEPYSVAITLKEENIPGWQYEIVGTDIAQKVLTKAEQGIFSQFEVQRGMPIQLLLKYFLPQQDTSWLIKPEIKQMASFKLQNLLADCKGLGMFDIIMCRNVLIYFEEATKVDIVRRLAQQLQPGGFLIIGSSESLMDTTLPLTPIPECRGCFQLKT